MSVTVPYKRLRIEGDMMEEAAQIIGSVMNSAVGSATSVERTINKDDAGGGPHGQLRRKFEQYGIDRPHKRLYYKLLNNNIFETKLIWQSLASWNATVTTDGAMGQPSGTRAHDISWTSTTTADKWAAPLYCWDLTSRNYQAVDGQADQVHATCRRLYEYRALNITRWENIACQKNDTTYGTLAKEMVFQPWRTNAQDFSHCAWSDKTVLKDAKVQLMLQGSQACKTFFYAYLVQFPEEEYSPHLADLNNDVYSVAFWRQFMRQGIIHPMVSQPGEYDTHPRMRVLKKWQWNTAPTTTDDNPTRAPVLFVDLDINLNRTCNWAYDPIIEKQGESSAQFKSARWDPITQAPVDSRNNYLKEVRSRVYLLLRCANGVDYAYTTPDTMGDKPQFDAKIIVTHIHHEGS